MYLLCSLMARTLWELMQRVRKYRVSIGQNDFARARAKSENPVAWTVKTFHIRSPKDDARREVFFDVRCKENSEKCEIGAFHHDRPTRELGPYNGSERQARTNKAYCYRL